MFFLKVPAVPKKPVPKEKAPPAVPKKVEAPPAKGMLSSRINKMLFLSFCVYVLSCHSFVLPL